MGEVLWNVLEDLYDDLELTLTQRVIGNHKEVLLILSLNLQIPLPLMKLLRRHYISQYTI